MQGDGEPKTELHRRNAEGNRPQQPTGRIKIGPRARTHSRGTGQHAELLCPQCRGQHRAIVNAVFVGNEYGHEHCDHYQ